MPKAQSNVQPTIAAEDIALRAYALYLSRGGEDGHDIEDWLAAERELREERSSRQKQDVRNTSAA